MEEARYFVESIADIRARLEQMGAAGQGEYSFTDTIFCLVGKNVDLNLGYIRLRHTQRSNRPGNPFTITRKQTILGNGTNRRVYTLHLSPPIDNETEAIEMLKFKCGGDLEQLLQYSRIGWEYLWEYSKRTINIFVESIAVAGLHPSVEIEAENAATLEHCAAQLGLQERITYSVPEMVRKHLQLIQ